MLQPFVSLPVYSHSRLCCTLSTITACPSRCPGSFDMTADTFSAMFLHLLYRPYPCSPTVNPDRWHAVRRHRPVLPAALDLPIRHSAGRSDHHGHPPPPRHDHEGGSLRDVITWQVGVRSGIERTADKGYLLGSGLGTRMHPGMLLRSGGGTSSSLMTGMPGSGGCRVSPIKSPTRVGLFCIS